MSTLQFYQMMLQEDAVVVDVRNDYEAVIGRMEPPPPPSTISSACSSTASSHSHNDNKYDGYEEDDNDNKPQQKYIDPRMGKSSDRMTWIQQPSAQEQLRNKTVLMCCTGGIRCEKVSVYFE
jgi:predicted sulfurtransferase